MDTFGQEIAALRGTGAIPKVPSLTPKISVDLTDTPTKKRKLSGSTGQPSYAAAAATGSVGGVEPLSLSGNQQSSMRMFQEVFQQQVKQRLPNRSPRNICFGSAKTS